MKYRRISVMIWNDEKFLQLSERGENVFFYLLTHPNMTSIGALRATPASLAEERRYRMTTEQFLSAFQELVDLGLVELADAVPLIVLPNFIKHNPPANPNQVKHYDKALEHVPMCALLRAQLARIAAFVRAEMRESIQEALPSIFLEASESSEGQPPPAKLKVIAPKTDPVRIYERLTKESPNPSQQNLIVQTVGDKAEAVDFWQKVIEGWLLVGGNKRNVAGMVNAFRGGEIPGEKKSSRPPAQEYELISPTTDPGLARFKQRKRAKQEDLTHAKDAAAQ